MASHLLQEYLFRRVKELLPPHVSLVDKVAEILHVSSDSAYRRIRGDTPVVLEEAKLLCDYFKISLDQLMNMQHGSTLFHNVRINISNYSYAKYLADLTDKVNYVNSFIEKEVIYITKDMPLFHNFYFKPLIAFRYYFWMKSIIQHPDFTETKFQTSCVSDEIVNLSRELLLAYQKIPTSEIWNTESINSIILQIEFYRDSGYFEDFSDVIEIYEALEKTFLHLKEQAEFGSKFMPGDSSQTRKQNYRLFYNRIVLGDNTILTRTDKVKTVFLNYDVLNYMYTRDEMFCEQTYQDMQNLMKKSTLISQTSEKQRNIFFNIMLNKIRDRINFYKERTLS